MTRLLLRVALGALLCAAPRAAVGAPTAAPDTLRGSWGGPRVDRLVAAAVRARRAAYSDSSLRSFRARAEGHVYYLAEVGRGPRESVVVRADQVALRVLWQAPDRSLQTLIGRRSEERLPTSIRYHADHLSVVLGNFGDRIRLGEGTEVRDVLHPVAPGAPSFYEYRLADSLGIRTAGEEIRIYRVEVRPRDLDRPGVVGEVHLTRRSKAVARMRFTFTPAAYRDRTVEEIEVDLRSALREGRYWLPAVQSVTVRRETSWLDFPVAGVIRTRLRVGDYRINPGSGPVLTDGHRLVSLPDARLSAFDGWSSGLYDGPLEPPERDAPGAGELRRRARELVRGRLLGGRSRLAAHAPDLSSVLRLRRAEGVLAGAGARYRFDDRRRLTLWAGHPAEAGGAEWRAGYRGPLAWPWGGGGVDGGTLSLDLYGDRLSDASPFAAASGLVSSLGFLLRGDDMTDPYFRDGGRLRLSLPAGPGDLALGLRYEAHRPAALVARPPGGEPAPPPVRPIHAGDLGALSAGYRLPAVGLPGANLDLRLGLEGATREVGDFGYVRALLRARVASAAPDPALAWRLEAGGGGSWGEVPAQRLFLVGGRGTVPGYPLRGWGGGRAGYLRVELSRELAGPWLQLRALGAAGWAEPGGAGRPGARSLGVGASGGLRPSVGLGVASLDGAVRLDLALGLDAGRWEWILSVAPHLWPML